MATTRSQSRRRTKSADKQVPKIAHIEKPGMDPKPPKEPKTAFERYREKVLPDFQKKMPNRTIASITQTIAHKWLKLKDSEKSKFNQEFLDDLNDRYFAELKKFEKKHGPIKHKNFSLDDPPLKGMYYNSVAGAGRLTKLEPENKMNDKKRGRSQKYQEILSDDEDEELPEEEKETQDEDEDEFFDLRRKALANDEDTGGSKKKKRGPMKRVPSPPKIPLTPFFYFKREQFDKMKKKHPRSNAAEIVKLLSEEWRSLSQREKIKYESKSEKAKKQYLQELQEYEEEYGQVEKRHRKKRKDSETEEPNEKRVRLSPYEMKVKDRLGNRP